MRRILLFALGATFIFSNLATHASQYTKQVYASFPKNAHYLLRQEVSSRLKREKIQSPAVFLYFFAYQGLKNVPSQAHTFASVVKVNQDKSQQWLSISWLPDDYAETKRICIFKNIWGAFTQDVLGISPCLPQKAKNHSLTQTFTWASESNKIVAIWGPYRMHSDTYFYFQKRIQYLHAKNIMYIADDFRWRKNLIALNCMHAISDMTPKLSTRGGFLNTGWPNWGINGSQHSLAHLLNHFPHLFYDFVDTQSFRIFINPSKSSP